jgi:hypothetical protein
MSGDAFEAVENAEALTPTDDDMLGSIFVVTGGIGHSEILRYYNGVVRLLLIASPDW